MLHYQINYYFINIPNFKNNFFNLESYLNIIIINQIPFYVIKLDLKILNQDIFQKYLLYFQDSRKFFNNLYH